MPDPDELDRWLHGLVVDEAARRRSVQGDLERLAAETETLLDVVTAAAADHDTLTFTVAGTTVAGSVALVGSDVVGVSTDAGQVLVAAAAVGSVEPGGATGRTGERPPRTDTDLRECLRLLQGEGRGLRLTCRDGRVMSGRLDSVGEDVLRLDRRPDRLPLYVSLASLALVSG